MPRVSLPALDGHTANVVGNTMVVYGGKTGPTAVHGSTYALDLHTDQWSRLECAGAVPAPRAFHSACVYDWSLIVFGGLLSVHVDDIHHNAFHVVANVDALPSGRLTKAGHKRRLPVADLHRVLQRKAEASPLHVLDLAAATQAPVWREVIPHGTLPPPRAGHSATIVRNAMYVHGGYSVHCTGRQTDEELRALSHVYELDLRSATWRVVDAGPSPQRWGATATLWGTMLVLFGGVDLLAALDDDHLRDLLEAQARSAGSGLASLDAAPVDAPVANAADPGEYASETNATALWHLEGREWRTATAAAMAHTAPPARALHTAVAFGPWVVVFGGVAGCGCRLFGDVFVLDLGTGAWSEVATTGAAPPPRSGHTACVVGSRMYVMGGLDAQLERSDRCWALCLRTWHWEAVAAAVAPEAARFGIRGGLEAPPGVGTFGQPELAASIAAAELKPRRPPTPEHYDPTAPEHRADTVPVAWSQSFGQAATSGRDAAPDDDPSALRWLRDDAAQSRSTLQAMLDGPGRRTAYEQQQQQQQGAHPAGAGTDAAAAARAGLVADIGARSERLRGAALGVALDPGREPSEPRVEGEEGSHWAGAVARLGEDSARWRATASVSSLAGASLAHVPVTRRDIGGSSEGPLQFKRPGARYVSPSLQKLRQPAFAKFSGGAL